MRGLGTSVSSFLNPDFEVVTSANRETVWVNASDGSCIGRFSRRFGIDVHNTAEAQIHDGTPQCLYCTHRPGTPDDWQRFIQKMREHHQIDLDESLISFL